MMNTRKVTLCLPGGRQRIFWCAAAISVGVAACGRQPEPSRAPYVPVAQVEAVYGSLMTVANYPTPNQNGTGERLGLFLDKAGTVWGLPLAALENGSMVGCIASALHEAPVTDTLPAAAANIIGATNTPTGWRGGTGDLELVYRGQSGDLQWRAVHSAALTSEPACWTQNPGRPSSVKPLAYFRLAPPVGKK